MKFIIESFSQFGSGLGRLDTPADMKIFNEKIYVVEERNHRVQVFSLDGNPLFVFGSYKETDDKNYIRHLDHQFVRSGNGMFRARDLSASDCGYRC